MLAISATCHIFPDSTTYKSKRSFAKKFILIALYVKAVSSTLLLLMAFALPSTLGLLIKRAPGDTLAASDLYGLGIRVGIYTQSLGMLFAVVRMTRSSGVGFKLASSANVFAILASWSIQVHRQEISPPEAWLIVTLMNA